MKMDQSQRGFTLIELMIVIAIIAIIAAIAIPNLIEARKGGNEASAIGALRTLLTSQTIFRESDRDGDNRPNYAASLTALGTAKIIDSKFASGTKEGYLFRIVAADDYSWSATADPAAPGRSGDRYFFVDESGVIRFSTSTTATSTSTPVGG